jgi:serine/threonine-protein kinase
MPIRPPSSGAIVDNKYRLAERIGGGGMGDVFRAETVATGRSVAIKFLHPELAQNMEVAQRFFQEAQAVTKIRHANVVEVLDAGTGEMGPYIVMEYLDGESVGSALNRVGRFEVDAAVATAVPVLEALDAAHRVGIIHRDLKPENIFIAFDATRGAVTVRLLDFGIAKVLDSGGPSPRTRTGVVFGTPDYLSPEQATGEGPLDGRSDLFAVGVLVYELLTGLRPFRAPTAVATAFKVVHADAPSIAAAGVHVDTRLEAIVHRLLQKEPSRRFPAAPEVIRELDRVSPDPARRAVALARVVGAVRRLAQGPSTLESERALPREVSSTKHLTPPLAHMQTQQAPRSVSPRLLDTARLPSASGDLPKTMRSSSPALSSAPPSSPPATPGTPLPTTAEATGVERGASASTPGHDAGLMRMSVAPPRAFPPRFAGRFQVRGPVLCSVDKVIGDVFGAVARDMVVAQLPEAHAREFQDGAINALVAYKLEALDAYMERATAMLLRDAGRWREFGRLAVDGELHNVVRTLLRPAVDTGAVVRRGVSTWARLFSFGTWQVSGAPGSKVTLTIKELDAMAQPLRLWLAGVVEQTLRRSVRADLRVVITSGEHDFASEMVCEIV